VKSPESGSKVPPRGVAEVHEAGGGIQVRRRQAAYFQPGRPSSRRRQAVPGSSSVPVVQAGGGRYILLEAGAGGMTGSDPVRKRYRQGPGQAGRQAAVTAMSRPRRRQQAKVGRGSAVSQAVCARCLRCCRQYPAGAGGSEESR